MAKVYSPKCMQLSLLEKFLKGDFQKHMLLLLLLSGFITATTNLSFSQCNGTLIWQDEFSNPTLDLTKWTYDIGNGCPGLCGWGNGELEYYTNSTNNVRTTGGILTIEARSQTMGSSNFTSGKIKTLGLFGHTYGRYEARMRLPQGAGLWPAFWMLSTANNWPMTGEIDIMEYRGDMNTRTSGTLHYGSPWPNNQWDGTDYFIPSGNLSSAWHDYVVEWDTEQIRWFLDGVKFKTETRNPNSLNPASTNNPWPWTSDFYIILNLAVGGWFTGVTTDAGVQLTKATFEIDYVRVYDMSQTPYSGTAKIFPSKIEAEEFDLSCGLGSYNDIDAVNQGGAFRTTEQVDIEATTDVGGGYDVGWMDTGEWLEYTINVPASGTYDFVVRAASGTGGGRMRIEMDGVNVSGAINIPNTGGWQTWQNFTVSSINLTTGTKVMRVFVENGGLNLNYITVAANTLPVEFISFDAVRKNNHLVQLAWETASEKNNSHFSIERSIDAMDWEVIGELGGAGNSSTLQHYSFQDAQAYSIQSYYRIKQLDHDGGFTYSRIAEVSRASEIALEVKVGNGEISIKDPENRIKEVKLLENTGKTILLEQRKTDDEMLIKTQNLSDGLYFLYIISEDAIEVKKLFLQ